MANDKNKVSQAITKVQDTMDKLDEVELTGTVQTGDSMILLRQTYDSLKTCKTNLEIVKDSIED